MTSKEIQKIIGKDRVLRGHLCIGENISSLLSFGHEFDVISMTPSGYIVEYEVKVDRWDFLRDKLKRKQVSYDIRDEDKIPNYFYYVVPEGMVKIEELPDYAGLFYVIKDKLKLIRKPILLHKKRHDICKIQTKLMRVYQEREYLGNCLMTYKNKLLKQKNETSTDTLQSNLGDRTPCTNP